MPSTITTAGVLAFMSLSGALAATNCTFSGSSGYSEISAKKSSCSTIIIDSLEVPAGETLDLEDLNDFTTVIHL
jgi:hypothetical protein